MEVGLSPGHIVLDGDSAPLTKKWKQPQFSVHVCCAQMAGWTKMPLRMEVDLVPGDIVLDGNPVSPQEGATHPPILAHVLWLNGCMDQGATWYWGRPRPRPHCVT